MRHVTPNWLFISAIVVVVLGAAALFFVTKPSEWALVLVVSVGIASFLFNSAVSFHSQLRDRAFNMMITAGRNKQFLVHIGRALRFFLDCKGTVPTSAQIQFIIAAPPTGVGEKDRSQSETTPPAAANEEATSQLQRTALNDQKLAAEVKRSIYSVANFFGEMAIGILMKELNEGLVREFYIGMFIKYYDDFEPFIRVIRNIGGEYNFKDLNYPVYERPLAYVNFEWLYRRWSPRYRAMVFAAKYGFVTEAEIMRPPNPIT